MRLVANTGADRVADLLRAWLAAGEHHAGHGLDAVTAELSVFAFEALRDALTNVGHARLLLPPAGTDLAFLGREADRAARNGLRGRWLAVGLAEWIERRTEVRRATAPVQQGLTLVRDGSGGTRAVLGASTFGTAGLGTTPGDPMSIVQAAESHDEAAQYSAWFATLWGNQTTRHGSASQDAAELAAELRALAAYRSPLSAYALMLHHLLAGREEELDVDRVVNAATGIRDTVIWNKLYKFQRDGVIGAIDKLNRYGGCIIADSVGLGKTFEALAVIKYFELRNNRVLVLCPKRLRDNWTLYATNDRRNVLAADRFRYDVLNHTDLSRDRGVSGDIDLANVNWGNYDLVVIDESHNFRNKKSPKQGSETRYDRLMRRIIREGVRTRVLMLSATPVNNRLADLRNQIAFATEGNDTALAAHGIASVKSTTERAQRRFNAWLVLDAEERTPAALVEMLGFDYFTLLDLLTIARSRRHIERYYGTAETGTFPERLPPINVKADVDSAGSFQSIREINQEIRRLNLAAYAPLRYVLPARQAAYDKKYNTELRDGESVFRQADREESLIGLMRVNVLKRMESAVTSFALTIERQLKDVERILGRIADHDESIEELDIADIDIDDPTFESLLAGRKVKVLLKDVDVVRWQQDLAEDRKRLRALLSAARAVTAARDAKLARLREMIAEKCRKPINEGNRKMIIFTAFADTADYLYAELSGWARKTLGLHTAVVTGVRGNRTTLPNDGKRGARDLGSVLAAFAPRAKERPAEFAAEGELDLLIATDCISEGQNLQDCDWLVNYDIHWNPVRIIQRFGRIDRLGSPNRRIQLANFWPNLELEEYINLEQRVAGRMVLLDVSATGEENLIEPQPGNQMNDLEYRRAQLLKLQEAVVDLEDLSAGLSIADLTLNDFRIDLAEYNREHPGALAAEPLGACAVATEVEEVPPGIVFCLRAEGAAAHTPETSYPLAPHYLVHVGEDGAVLLPHTAARQILERLKRVAAGRATPDPGACARNDRATRNGENMAAVQRLLAAAAGSVSGKQEERAAASLFSPGGTHAARGEFAGTNDFETLAYLVVLPEKG